MKIKKGIVIQEVGGQWVAVATGSAAKDVDALCQQLVQAGIAQE